MASRKILVLTLNECSVVLDHIVVREHPKHSESMSELYPGQWSRHQISVFFSFETKNFIKFFVSAKKIFVVTKKNSWILEIVLSESWKSKKKSFFRRKISKKIACGGLKTRKIPKLWFKIGQIRQKSRPKGANFFEVIFFVSRKVKNTGGSSSWICPASSWSRYCSPERRLP